MFTVAAVVLFKLYRRYRKCSNAVSGSDRSYDVFFASSLATTREDEGILGAARSKRKKLMRQSHPSVGWRSSPENWRHTFRSKAGTESKVA